MAASSDMFKIRSRELAVQKAVSPEVKEVAEMMIKDHTTASKNLITAAQQDGVSVPAEMITRHSAKVAALGDLSGVRTSSPEGPLKLSNSWRSKWLRPASWRLCWIVRPNGGADCRHRGSFPHETGRKGTLGSLLATVQAATIMRGVLPPGVVVLMDWSASRSRTLRDPASCASSQFRAVSPRSHPELLLALYLS